MQCTLLDTFFFTSAQAYYYRSTKYNNLLLQSIHDENVQMSSSILSLLEIHSSSSFLANIILFPCNTPR